MIVVGILIGIICMGLFIFCAIEEEWVLCLIFGVILIGCACLIGFDIASPVNTTVEKTIITNDYTSYELNIDSNKLGVVKLIDYTPKLRLAILNRYFEYIFVEFVDEKDYSNEILLE